MKSRYSVQADIFSIGMVFYFVFEGKPARLAGATTKLEHFQLLDQGKRPVFKKTSVAHRQIADLCWRDRPCERPTATELGVLLRGVEVKKSTMNRLLVGGKSIVKPTSADAITAMEVFEAVSSRKSRRQVKSYLKTIF